MTASGWVGITNCDLELEIADCDIKFRLGGRRHPPFAYTEHGVAMLSSVLRSKKAAQVNVEIMRALVRLRQMLASNARLARKLSDLERKYDAQLKVVFEAIRRLMAPPEPKKRKIGFLVEKNRDLRTTLDPPLISILPEFLERRTFQHESR